MKLLRQLRIFFSFFKTPSRKKDFIYPYSNDVQQKREEIWQNLQKGLLLEDKGIFISWLLPFAEMNSIAEQRRERADRTELYLGKHTILGGYEAHLEVMRWKYKPDEELIKRLSENLGQDSEGEQRFNYLRQYLTSLLGEPARMEIEKFGSSDIGVIIWEKGVIALTLVGIEHVSFKYTFHIGIKFTGPVY